MKDIFNFELSRARETASKLKVPASKIARTVLAAMLPLALLPIPAQAQATTLGESIRILEVKSSNHCLEEEAEGYRIIRTRKGFQEAYGSIPSNTSSPFATGSIPDFDPSKVTAIVAFAGILPSNAIDLEFQLLNLKTKKSLL